MRVAMYYNNNDVRLEEMPKPEIGKGELLVKVHSSGICGSDVMEWYRLKKAPLVLGHEIAGEIEAIGEGVRDFKAGDRVFVSHHVPCMMCRYCLDGRHSCCDTLRSTNFYPGGFSEYVRVPEINVRNGTYLLPDEMTYDEGVFIEPLACVVRGQRHANLRPGQSVIVIGSGMAGLLHIRLARAAGASRIFATDINEYRLSAAEKLGADHVINAGEDVPSRLRELNDGRLADQVIVCTAAEKAVEQAFKCFDRGGTILFFAPTKPGELVPLPLFEVWRDEVTITTSYAGSPRDIMTAVELIRSGSVEVKDMITHKLPLSETGIGFKLAAEAKESIKVMIEPQK